MSVNVRKNGGMINRCQVGGEVCNMSGRMKVCRCVLSVRQRHDGTVERRCSGGALAGTMALWCHGNTPSGKLAWWCHGGAPSATATRLRHVRGMWHGGTVWLVAR